MTDDVKRYFADVDPSESYATVYMDDAPDGDWVRADDYDKARAEIERLRAVLDRVEAVAVDGLDYTGGYEAACVMVMAALKGGGA